MDGANIGYVHVKVFGVSTFHPHFTPQKLAAISKYARVST